MKKMLLILPLVTLVLSGCFDNGKTTVPTSEPVNDGTTTVNLNLSNFERYISYTKHEGWTGAAGFSSYEAWLEFEGLLSFGIYDASVVYTVGSKSYDFKLDVSGSGKTDYFDRIADLSITNVYGTITYRL